MSLQRRISAAVAVAVAAVVVVLALVVYFSVRSNLIGQVDRNLAARATQVTHGGPGGPGPDGPDGFGRGRDGDRPFERFSAPRQPFGGATGYVQLVSSDGSVLAAAGNARLPVTDRVKQVASTGDGNFYADETVAGTHVRVLTVPNPTGAGAVQIALPLTDTDKVLDRLVAVFVAVIVAGILLALLLGGVIGRTALAPIRAFTTRTENVTGALDEAERLDETGPEELVRLADSFNRTLDALERSVEAQRHLVADASHELRTPIAALRSNIQIFLEAERLPEVERKALQQSIIDELDDLTQLVADVVELARSSDSHEADEPLRLDRIVEEAIARTSRRAPTLKFDAQLEAVTIEHVPDRVARAISNMLDNARKWSPPQQTVEVRLDAEGTLTVRDHGPGFETADLDKVFDRFYRAAAARRMTGSGLGLAIVRQAAEHDGGFATAFNAEDGGAVVQANFGAPIDV